MEDLRTLWTFASREGWAGVFALGIAALGFGTMLVTVIGVILSLEPVR